MIKELVEFDGIGRIITSDYLGFNSPDAFAELHKLRQFGIDVRLHNDTAFHPKGYIFEHRRRCDRRSLAAQISPETALATES